MYHQERARKKELEQYADKMALQTALAERMKEFEQSQDEQRKLAQTLAQ